MSLRYTSCRMNRRRFVLALSSAPLLAQTAVPVPETAAPAPDLEWVDARKLTVEGFGFKDVKSPYDRFPARAEGVVPPAVWNFSRESAGAFPAHWDPKLRIPRGQVVAAASIVSPKY